MPQIRVLLIEDNRLLREGITAMLNEQPDIKAASTSGDGDTIEIARKIKPHVVLLDLGLAGQKSLKLVEIIKKELPSTEVVVMYLIPVQTDVVDFVKAGVSGFIHKDSGLDDVLKTIKAVITGVKVLPPPLTRSLFSQIVDNAIESGKIDGLISSARMTRREQEVIDLITKGRSNKEIASELAIAVHTVKSHVHNILEKLALHTRLELASHKLREDTVKRTSETLDHDSTHSPSQKNRPQVQPYD